MKYIQWFFVAVVLAMAMSACVTPKEINYLQDLEPGQNIPLNSKFEAVVCPYDQLRISVMGFGLEKELAEPFNPFGNAQNMATQNNAGYLVDVNGDIEFPNLGKLHVQGMTRLELQEFIKTELVENGYMNEPMVDVRFASFKVYVLGTADGGKVLNISNERCTFLEALAMAGGLNRYTRRDRVAVMREIDGEMVTHFLDPRSTEIFDDPFFLLQQNDVIITESFRRTYAQEGLNTTLNIVTTVVSLSSAVLTVYLLLSGKQ